MVRKEILLPVVAIALLSLGGALIHARAHAVSFDPSNPGNPALFVPFVSGILGVVVAPLLLCSRRGFVIGYLINGLTVIIGTITMAAFSLSVLPSPLTVKGVLMGTMLPSILLLFPKLFLGQSILFQYHPNGMGRLFTTFWWTKHFIYLGAVFTLGHFLWR